MSGSKNLAILVGRAGKDAELKTTPSGQTLARFSLATSERWKDASGDKKERTDWHNIILFGKQAEFAEQYVRKGRLVYVEGRIQYGEFTDKEGNKRPTTSIRADNFMVLDKFDTDDKPSAKPSSTAKSEYDDDEPVF